MTIIRELLSNTVLLATVAAWLSGQGTKVLLLAVTGKLTKERLTGGGGMPSGHTATVAGLVTSIALVEGLHSSIFVLALFFAIFAIYDALGVRYITGIQGQVLNRMQKNGATEEEPVVFPEKMGHTVPEVVVGLILGIAVSAIVTMLLK